MPAETNLTIREWQELAKGRDVLTFARPFIVCEKCGNKRCPHATDRALECTGSNAPGQPGSDYE
jgi:NADH pyrophosphatase NudC (nudix superfamily)